MFFILLILLYASLFFLVIPGIGAIAVRQRWRNFRASLVKSLEFPLYHPERSALATGGAQMFRYFGSLEALQDNDLLWLRQDQTSVSVKLENEAVFFLPPDAPLDLDSPFSETVQKMHWQKTGILAEGIGVFVYGSLGIESGIPRFSRPAGGDFLVIFFAGSPPSVLPRALLHGRQQNEYWNDFTPFSLLIGFVALLSLAFVGFQQEATRFLAVVSASFSLLPFLPLMPPGILLFFTYRYLWRKGRTLRARKDLLALGALLAGSQAIVRETGYAASPADFQEQRHSFEAQGAYHIVIPKGQAASRAIPSAVQFQAEWPRDPMALSILVEGQPEDEGRLISRKIRRYELVALIALGLGLLGNFYLTLNLIIQVINNAWLRIG